MSKVARIKGIADETISILEEYPDIKEFENYQNDITENVSNLLSCEKPKLILCGVYSAGKSTLVNVLMREQVAKVGADPVTDRIKEYTLPELDYIIVDSPGVDSYPEHEHTTDEYVKKCHAALVVISSKNAESETNYRKINQWMTYDKPLIIVINAKGGEDLNGEIITNIRLAIEQNMRRAGYSRDRKYDVVAVNANLGLKAIQTDDKIKKQSFYNYSNMNELEMVIGDKMKDANTVFISSISALLMILSAMENKLMAMEVGNDDDELTSTLDRISNESIRINETIKRKIEMVCNIGKSKLIEACMNAQSTEDINKSVENINKEITQSIDNELQYLMGSFSSIFSNSLEKYNISMSKNGIVKIDGKEYDFNKMMIDANSDPDTNNLSEKENVLGNIISAAAGGILGSTLTNVVSKTASKTTLGSLIGTSGGAAAAVPLGPIIVIVNTIVSAIIENSIARRKKEDKIMMQIMEENKRRQAAIDAKYKQVQASVGSTMSEAQRVLTAQATEMFSKTVSKLRETVNLKIAADKSYEEKIAESRKRISQLKAELEGLKNSIN